MKTLGSERLNNMLRGPQLVVGCTGFEHSPSGSWICGLHCTEKSQLNCAFLDLVTLGQTKSNSQLSVFEILHINSSFLPWPESILLPFWKSRAHPFSHQLSSVSPQIFPSVSSFQSWPLIPTVSALIKISTYLLLAKWQQPPNWISGRYSSLFPSIPSFPQSISHLANTGFSLLFDWSSL